MIRLQKLTFGFDAPLFRDMSLRFPPGRVAALLGPNGAGKSTLLRLAAGLLAPWEGDVRIDGARLRDLAPLDRAKVVSYLPQTFDPPGDWTVSEMVFLGNHPHVQRPPAPRPLRERTEEVRSLLDLHRVWDRPLDAISGGEVRRTLLARVLLQDTQVIILDEPAAHLDIGHQRSLFVLLGRLARSGRSILLASHDLNLSLLHGQDPWILDASGDLRPLPPSPQERRELIERTFGIPVTPVTHGTVTCFLPAPVL